MSNRVKVLELASHCKHGCIIRFLACEKTCRPVVSRFSLRFQSFYAKLRTSFKSLFLAMISCTCRIDIVDFSHLLETSACPD